MLIIRNILLTMAGLLLIVYGAMVVYAYWPYGEGIPIAQLASAEDKFVDANGIQIRYREWGQQQENSKTIVFIHGFANSLQSFKQIGPYLAADYRVIAIDMPGFGLSEKPIDHDYGNAPQAQVIVDFIKALELRDVLIGGHSMGGAHAIHVALMSSEIDGVILFNPGIITTGVPPATQYFVFPLPRLAAKIFGEREFRKSFIASSYLDPSVIDDEVMDELMLGARAEGYIEGTTVLMSYYTAGNEIELLDQIKVPTLIVWGAQDKRKPADEATDLRDLIDGSRLVIIEDAAHYVHEEQPQKAAAAIIAAKGFWRN